MGEKESLLLGQVVRISGCWELPFQTILFIEKLKVVRVLNSLKSKRG